MDWMKIANVNLIKGKGGGDPRNGLCIMEMVSWFAGANTVTDRPSCASPFLTELAICVNDSAPSQNERNTLKPLLPLLSGSVDPENEKARAWFVMRELALRGVAAKCEEIGRPEQVAKLRAATAPKVLTTAMLEVRADFKAYAKAYAHSDAAAADAAADDAADAAADDAADAANAYAYAYANAYAYAHAKRGKGSFKAFRAERRLATWRLMRDVLFEATKLGKHGGLDLETVPAREAELVKAMA